MHELGQGLLLLLSDFGPILKLALRWQLRVFIGIMTDFAAEELGPSQLHQNIVYKTKENVNDVIVILL